MTDAAGKLRVLFLGSDVNPLSVACGAALSSIPWIELAVGIDGSVSRGPWRVVSRSLAQFGVAYTARRAADVARARMRFAIRGMGVSSAVTFGSLAELATARDLTLLRHVHLREPATVAEIERWQPDVVAVAAFGQIIRDPLLSRFPQGIVNVHPSLLPQNRGPNPHYWVLHHHERETGVTVHFIDEGVDTGDIIVQEAMPVHPDDTERSLQRRTAVVGAELLSRALAHLRDGTAPRRPQDHGAATYFPNPPRGASRL